MKDLSVREETMKILQEKTGRNLFELSYSNFFLHTLPETRETKAKMSYWDFINIKSFCTVKETINTNKGSLQTW